MKLKEHVCRFLVANHLKEALDLLQSQPNPYFQFNHDVILLQRNYQNIIHQEQSGLLTYEEVNVEKNKLSRNILLLTDRITTDKPDSSLSNFAESIPTKYFLTILLFVEIILGLFGSKMNFQYKNIDHFTYYVFYFSILLITFIATIWSFTFKKKEKLSFIPIDETLDEETHKILDTLLKRYQNRLKQKTGSRLALHPKLTYFHDTDSIHLSEDTKNTSIIEQNLVNILQKHNHILILGEPGAGKTTFILEMAKEWLEKKINHQIPVIVNLSSWKNNGLRFDEWLVLALNSGYGFSKQKAKNTIFNEELLIFLDGLDEVGFNLSSNDEQEKLQIDCLKSIDQYLSLFETKYIVITCRSNTYKSLKTTAPVKATVLINPLDLNDIKSNLEDQLFQKLKTRDETAAKSMLYLATKHNDLALLFCNPFYFNTASEVLDERMIQFDFPNDFKQIQNFLIDKFIAEKLQITNNPKAFNASNSIHYLAFIASLLKSESLVNFELTSLQPLHVKKKWAIHLIVGLISALACFLTLSPFLFSSISYNNYYSATSISCVAGILIGAIVDIKLKSSYNGLNVTPTEHVRFTPSKLYSKPFWVLFFILLPLNLLFMVFHFVGPVKFPIHFFIAIVGASGLLSIYYGLLDKKSFTVVNFPYSRFINDFRFELFQCGSTLLLFFTTLITIPEFSFSHNPLLLSLVILNIFISIILVSFMNSAIFRHILVRICLYWEKKAPFQLVSFFTYCTDARILEQDGGQWRFRHQILQDYFAKKWEEEQAKS